MKHLLFFVALFAFVACEEAVTVPKPRAYPKILYPEKIYAPFQTGYCAFTFECPQYAVVEQDTSFFGEKPKDDCWFNLSVPGLNAKIHCSYSPIRNKKEFEELLQDAHVLAQKHNIKATYIGETPINRSAEHVHGILFDIEGPAASPCQFFLTDSTHHFLRGALYFNTASRPDSLAPVVDFMRKDVERLVGSLRWEF